MRAKHDIIDDDTPNPLLQACHPQTRTLLYERGELRHFEAGSLFYPEGADAGKVIFLLRGSLQVDKTGARGRRQVMCSMTPEGCGGICLLLLCDKAQADVRGVQSGQALLLDLVEFQAIAVRDEHLCTGAWRGAADCVEHFCSLVEHLSFHKVSQRAAMTLISRSEKDGDLIRLTQAELAAEIGTTREVVARCLAGMQTSGTVRLGRGRITVIDRAKLGQMT
jgi:CRP-like cAMP-binding protein